MRSFIFIAKLEEGIKGRVLGAYRISFEEQHEVLYSFRPSLCWCCAGGVLWGHRSVLVRSVPHPSSIRAVILKLFSSNNLVVQGLRNSNSAALSSVLGGWFTAYVHTAIFAAAEASRFGSREVQQVAVTHAAHNALSLLLPAQQPTFIAATKSILDRIGAGRREAEAGKRAGEEAWAKVQRSRVGDGASAVCPSL